MIETLVLHNLHFTSNITQSYNIPFYKPSTYTILIVCYGLPALSAGFEARCDRCNCTNEFVNWPVLGPSCDPWERGRSKAGLDHCVDGGGGGARFRHGERVVGL